MNQAGNRSLQGRLRVRIRIMKFRDALFTLLVFAAPAAFGQNSASLGGTIQDSTGAVVPKATVRLTSHEQGTVRSAESNQTGLYSFSFFRAVSMMWRLPGQYDFHVRHYQFGAEPAVDSGSTEDQFLANPGDTPPTAEPARSNPGGSVPSGLCLWCAVRACGSRRLFSN